MNSAGIRTVVYEPNQRARMGLVAGFVMMTRGILESRELIWQLFKRDFLANYKQSYLGAVWIFIAPVIGIVSWVFLNAAGILKPGDVGVPYPVYVIIGSTVWGLFMDFYANSARSLSNSAELVRQINFPHVALVAKQVALTLASFLINVVLILSVMLIFRVAPSWKIMLLPIAIVPVMFIGAGLGMVVAVITSVAHDVDKAVTALLGFLMYLTPVIYSPDQKSELIRDIAYWNPLAYLVGGARDLILKGGVGDHAGYAASVAFSAVFFLFTWRLFFLSEHKVAERL